MMKKRFQRKIEDFICGHCDAQISGNGYTNHCPNCLWSRHVDNNPGDRANECGGMMEPADLAIKSGEYIIRHRCKQCGAEKNNKISPQDSQQALVKLSLL